MSWKRKKKCVICKSPVPWPNLKYCWKLDCYKKARKNANKNRQSR